MEPSYIPRRVCKVLRVNSTIKKKDTRIENTSYQHANSSFLSWRKLGILKFLVIRSNLKSSCGFFSYSDISPSPVSVVFHRSTDFWLCHFAYFTLVDLSHSYVFFFFLLAHFISKTTQKVAPRAGLSHWNVLYVSVEFAAARGALTMAKPRNCFKIMFFTSSCHAELLLRQKYPNVINRYRTQHSTQCAVSSKSRQQWNKHLSFDMSRLTTHAAFCGECVCGG